MLYTEATAYLLQKLKDAGLKTKPYTTMKSLSRTMEEPCGERCFPGYRGHHAKRLENHLYRPRGSAAQASEAL